jgi:endoglucanase
MFGLYAKADTPAFLLAYDSTKIRTFTAMPAFTLRTSLAFVGGLLCIALVYLLFEWSYIFQHDTFKRHIPVLTGSPMAFLGNPPGWLKASWQGYSHKFIQHDGRVMDFYTNNSTTSEGQSYAMLQAVWVNDKKTFDTLWNWTVHNLQTRKEHKLFSWKWGERKEGSKASWGIVDESAASDADQDIAFALLMAHQRWKETHYKQAALTIMHDVWQHEVTPSKWGPVLLPGDWHRFSKEVPDVVLLNPSYMAPYIYRLFAQVDPAHPWEKLVQSSYRIWDDALKLSASGFPPDWVWFKRSNGDVYLKEADKDFPDMTSQFGYEACRMPWRLYLDVALTRFMHWPNPTGELLVERIRTALDKRFPGITDAHGKETGQFESKAREAGFWPYLILEEDRLYYQHAPYYNWHEAQTSEDYYARNWMWFAVWLQVFQQRQLAKQQPPADSQLLPLFTYSLQN